MPTTTEHDELAAAQAASHAAYVDFTEAHELETVWAIRVADELAIAVDSGLKLPDVLARALGQYRAQHDVTAPLRARWRECSDRARQLYRDLYPADRALSVAGGTVMPLAE